MSQTAIESTLNATVNLDRCRKIIVEAIKFISTQDIGVENGQAQQKSYIAFCTDRKPE
nr:hypothetical protein [uncultured Prevotella sp.]